MEPGYPGRYANIFCKINYGQTRLSVSTVSEDVGFRGREKKHFAVILCSIIIVDCAAFHKFLHGVQLQFGPKPNLYVQLQTLHLYPERSALITSCPVPAAADLPSGHPLSSPAPALVPSPLPGQASPVRSNGPSRIPISTVEPRGGRFMRGEHT